MSSFSAILQHGCFVLDDGAPRTPGLPPLHLVLPDEQGDPGEDELRRLEAALQRSRDDSLRGDTVPMEEVMAELRSLRQQ